MMMRALPVVGRCLFVYAGLIHNGYYEIRGLPRTESDAEINKAFRKLARKYHPDVAKDNKKAEGKFIKGSLLIIDTDSAWR